MHHNVNMATLGDLGLTQYDSAAMTLDASFHPILTYTVPGATTLPAVAAAPTAPGSVEVIEAVTEAPNHTMLLLLVAAGVGYYLYTKRGSF